MSERVILIGMPGVGKSAVGRAVAERLGWPFVDLDDAIEVREGRAIAAIFAEDGEPAFRAAEAAALSVALTRAPLALACGGGAPCHGDNLARMQAAGLVVWLRASLDTLLERTAGGGRPLLEGDRGPRLAALLVAREPVFQRAHRAVDTDERTVDDVAGAVVACWEEARGAGDDSGRAG